jgi:hypothetical protein
VLGFPDWSQLAALAGRWLYFVPLQRSFLHLCKNKKIIKRNLKNGITGVLDFFLEGQPSTGSGMLC